MCHHQQYFFCNCLQLLLLVVLIAISLYLMSILLGHKRGNRKADNQFQQLYTHLAQEFGGWKNFDFSSSNCNPELRHRYQFHMCCAHAHVAVEPGRIWLVLVGIFLAGKKHSIGFSAPVLASLSKISLCCCHGINGSNSGRLRNKEKKKSYIFRYINFSPSLLLSYRLQLYDAVAQSWHD